MPNAGENKCAIVLSDSLPAGLAANAAGVLSMTLGARVDDLVGDDVEDADGTRHLGIIATPLPVLRASTDGLARMLAAAVADDVLVVGFSSLAQRCRDYEDYTRRLSATRTDELDVVGLALHGPRKKVDKHVGSLPLLR